MGRNRADGAPADHFAHSRRRIENNEVTLDTIADSLLRIFVRMEKLDASLGHLSRRITDIENLNKTSARRGSSTESTAPEASDDRFLHTGDSHSRRSE